MISGFGVRLKQIVESNRIAFDAQMYGDRTSGLKSEHLSCGAPSGAPPANYGAAPATHFVERALVHPYR